MNENDDEFFEHIGERQVWGGYREFGIRPEDRRQHLYAVGKSGTGKTTLLRNLLIHDIQAGRGIGLVDVHGDLAHDLLDYIPPHRFDDVVYFRPGDTNHPIGLNLFHEVDVERRHVVASNIVGAFKSIWRASWGPRMEYVMYAGIASLLECQGTTLLGLQRIFTDSRYRQWVVRNVNDPLLRAFWTDEFDRWDSRLRNEILAPIQNKVGQLLMTPIMRNVLGQVRRKIDFRFMMDESRIFIANLQKAELGEDKASLLGALIVAGMHHAALGRADLHERDRTQFSLYIDEFQCVQTDSFSGILSEARKYGLSLVLSHQFANQLDPVVADAVFGNVGNIIAFRVSSADAKRLADEFGAGYDPGMFTGLENHKIFGRVLSEGRLREPFFGRTLPPTGTCYGRREKAIKHSREKYGVHRDIVEGKIRKWIRSSP